MTRRDYHGRGIRRPIFPPSLPAYRSRREQLEDLVAAIADDLEKKWGKHWGKLEFAVEDVPPSDPSPWEDQVPLGRLFPADLGLPALIVLYRRPIEMRADAEYLPIVVKNVIVHHLAFLLNRSPEEIDPDGNHS